MLGDVIRELRIEQGYTQQSLSYQCRISQSHVHRIENNIGSKGPSVHTLELIVKALDIKLSDLFLLVEQEKGEET